MYLCILLKTQKLLYKNTLDVLQHGLDTPKKKQIRQNNAAKPKEPLHNTWAHTHTSTP